ncbi:MAG TPA: WG repeat-containing protein [Nannocystaceae bacterium]|nr:WG repeat-containing protein [Nannocystaceae bacterium]
MPGTLSRATQIVYRMCPRLASDEETLVFMASGEVTLTTKEGKHQVKLPESAFQEVLERLEQYSFKSITGVHGDAMADYIHEVEVHEGPKKKARCTLRFNHEFGTLIGQAPTGIKETITLLSRLAEKLTHGIGRDEALDTLLIELGRGIDFPYINPHGGPGAFILLDPEGNQLPASSKSWTMPYADGLLPCKVGDKYGFIKPSGQQVIPSAFHLTLGFSEGLAAVKVESLWGYIDTAGNMVIAPAFTSASHFSDGMAHVQRGEQGGFIDTKGTFTADRPGTLQVGKYSEGFARFKALNRIGVAAWGYLNKAGDIVIQPEYDMAHDFLEGLARIQLDDLYGFIDPKGNLVIEPQYPEIADFHEGRAALHDEGRTGYIDPKGELVIDMDFRNGGNFSEGLAAVGVGTKVGYIDRDGKVAIEPAYDVGEHFSDGRAAVRVTHRWGYIDRRGRMVIQPLYESARPFNDGVGCVRLFAKPRPIVHTGSPKVIVNLGKGKPGKAS